MCHPVHSPAQNGCVVLEVCTSRTRRFDKSGEPSDSNVTVLIEALTVEEHDKKSCRHSPVAALLLRSDSGNESPFLSTGNAVN